MKLYYTTFPDDETRKQIADTLVEERLAGCIVSTDVSSIYLWEGEKQTDDEVAALFKTTESKVEDLLVRLDELHPYDVPSILEIPVASNKSYDRWLHEATNSIVDRSSDDETILVRFDIGPIFRVDATQSVSETAANLRTPDVSGELADLLSEIIALREELKGEEDVYPLLVNGELAATDAPLSMFDDEPVHISLR